MIPDKVRRERLLNVDTDPITTAVAVSGNPNMQLLYAVWYKYIEPGGDGKMDCPTCLNNVLSNFRAMKPALLQLEREYKILNSL